MFLFGVFGGMCDVNSCNVFMLLFMVLGVPISAMLCKRAVLTLWHAFMFLGLRFFLFSSFRLVAYAAYSNNSVWSDPLATSTNLVCGR
jgi:hypothetical protein